MITPPTAPAPGKPVSASFFGSLIRWVKSRLLIAGVGYRLRTTPNGTVLELDLPKGGGASAARLPGCFEIRRPNAGEDGEGGDSGGFDNPYMLIGGRPFYMAGAISDGFDYENCIVAVCLDVTSATPQPYIDTFADFLAMVEAVKADPSLAVHPLYQLGEGGAVVCDMRTIPTITSWEYGT